MIPRICLRLSHWIWGAICVQQLFGHENDQDGIHPIITESLGRLVPDNIRHSRGHLVGLYWRGKVFSRGHRLAGLFHVPIPYTSQKTETNQPRVDSNKKHRFPVSFFHESTGPFSFRHSFSDRGRRDGFAYSAVALLSPRFFASLR